MESALTTASEVESPVAHIDLVGALTAEDVA